LYVELLVHRIHRNVCIAGKCQRKDGRSGERVKRAILVRLTIECTFIDACCLLRRVALGRESVIPTVALTDDVKPDVYVWILSDYFTTFNDFSTDIVDALL